MEFVSTYCLLINGNIISPQFVVDVIRRRYCSLKEFFRWSLHSVIKLNARCPTSDTVRNFPEHQGDIVERRSKIRFSYHIIGLPGWEFREKPEHRTLVP